MIELLEFLHQDKKIKTLTDTTELTDYAVFQATVQQKTEMLTIILKWIHNTRNKKNHHRNKTYNANQGSSKFNHNAMIYAAKKNDYQRVKILFKYGYRLEQKDNITDPLKKIELFKVKKGKILICVKNIRAINSKLFQCEIILPLSIS